MKDEVNYSTSVYRQARNDVDVKRAFKGFIVENLQRKLSANERKKREEQQMAAIKIQRFFIIKIDSKFLFSFEKKEPIENIYNDVIKLNIVVHQQLKVKNKIEIIEEFFQLNELNLLNNT